MMGLVLLLVFCAGFKVCAQDTLRDIRYGNADVKQVLDVYRPAGVKGKLPVIFWIHGGGWWTGSKKDIAMPWIVGHGYALVSVGYRFSQDSIFPAQIRDCNAALRFVFAHAGEWGLDTTRVVLAGASAGGHLSSLLATSQNNGVRAFDPFGGRIRGVLNFYGPGDLYAFHGDGAGYKVDSVSSSVSRMLGASPLVRPDLAKWASPATYVDRGDPPVLIIHGDKDPIVHYYLGPLFYNVLRLAGVRTRLVTVAGGGHGGPEFADAER